MRLACLAAILALPLAQPGWAAAAQSQAGPSQRAQQIAACLVRHSTEAHEDAIRQVILSALSEQPDSVVKDRMTAFTDAIFQLGVRDCGMEMSDFTTEDGKLAVRLYGQQMSGKVVRDAFARMRR